MADIALLGDRDATLITHRAVDAVVERFPSWARGSWIATDSPDAAQLDDYHGVWVAPGTPYRDDQAVYAAIRRRRERRAPILGTCGGFQYMVVEYARHVAGLSDAAHAEADPTAHTAVVAPLACRLVGEERAVWCVPGTRLAEICGVEPFTGFHLCGFGVADGYLERLTSAGLVVGARGEDAGVEGIELPEHPFYVATLFQPQMAALRGARLHPLIDAFLSAARAMSGAPADVPSAAW
ncbi:MAG TPA: gamma-glutamyl-gamma-aminobutyrate hydrolase family protein [Egibacteraceae bacterium]|nr:gamma-glutamyl-gamma-aminobutyrate hydrolase family protein [Egibacteraceae bacterium]